MFTIKQRIIGALVILSLGGLVVADGVEDLTPEDYCTKFYNDTSVVMELRQEDKNGTEEIVRQIASSSFGGEQQILNDVVEEAFKIHYEYTFERKQQAIKNFESKGYEICLAHRTKS